jgi:hypothetical protein
VHLFLIIERVKAKPQVIQLNSPSQWGGRPCPPLVSHSLASMAGRDARIGVNLKMRRFGMSEHLRLLYGLVF